MRRVWRTMPGKGPARPAIFGQWLQQRDNRIGLKIKDRLPRNRSRSPRGKTGISAGRGVAKQEAAWAGPATTRHRKTKSRRGAGFSSNGIVSLLPGPGATLPRPSEQRWFPSRSKNNFRVSTWQRTRSNQTSPRWDSKGLSPLAAGGILSLSPTCPIRPQPRPRPRWPWPRIRCARSSR